MATKYIESVATSTIRDLVAPAVPGKAGIVFREDIAGLDIRNPATGTFVRMPSALTGLQTIRRRCTVAEVNAGVTLLAAITGFKYRMVRATAISVGGAAGAVTTVDILATQGAAGVKLVAFAQASLTQSALLTNGDAGSAILADGASFVANDAATAITVGKTGASVTTATHIDIEFSYVLEAA